MLWQTLLPPCYARRVSDTAFPRRLVKKVENLNFPLVALGAVRDIRAYLDEVEQQAIRKARDLGASAEDIGQALGITRQGTYYKLKNLDERSQELQDEEADDITVVLETEERTPSPGE